MVKLFQVCENETSGICECCDAVISRAQAVGQRCLRALSWSWPLNMRGKLVKSPGSLKTHALMLRYEYACLIDNLVNLFVLLLRLHLEFFIKIFTFHIEPGFTQNACSNGAARATLRLLLQI